MNTLSWLRFFWGLWSLGDFLLSLKGSIFIFASCTLWAVSAKLHERWTTEEGSDAWPDSRS